MLMSLNFKFITNFLPYSSRNHNKYSFISICFCSHLQMLHALKLQYYCTRWLILHLHIKYTQFTNSWWRRRTKNFPMNSNSQMFWASFVKIDIILKKHSSPWKSSKSWKYFAIICYPSSFRSFIIQYIILSLL